MATKPHAAAPRRLFTTTVEAAPAPRPAQVSAKTQAEQAAGLARLKAYHAVPAPADDKE